MFYIFFRIKHVSEKENEKYYNDSFYTPFPIIIPNCLLNMQHKYTHLWIHNDNL